MGGRELVVDGIPSKLSATTGPVVTRMMFDLIEDDEHWGYNCMICSDLYFGPKGRPRGSLMGHEVDQEYVEQYWFND